MKTIRLLLLTLLVMLAAAFPAVAQQAESGRTDYSQKYPQLDKQFRVSLELGGSFGAISESEYLETKAVSGVNFGADLLYFPRQAWGFGAKFNGKALHYKNDASSSGKSDIQNYYFGAMGVWRKFDRRNKNALVLGCSMGLMNYRNTADRSSIFRSGSSLGFGSTMEVGYDLRTGNRTFLGFKLAIMGGTFTTDAEYDDGSIYVDLGLVTIDLSVTFPF